MDQAKTRQLTPTLLSGALLGLVLVAGCDKSTPEPSPAPNRPTPGPNAGTPEITGPFAAGKKVFAARCARCHAIDGKGGPAWGGGPRDGGPRGGPPMQGGPRGRNKGPDLAKVGADPKHTRQWLIEYISDPKMHNPKSRMPRFAGKINEEEFGALADYLGSLKGN